MEMTMTRSTNKKAMEKLPQGTVVNTTEYSTELTAKVAYNQRSSTTIVMIARKWPKMNMVYVNIMSLSME
jgi:hypothetical protein